MSKPKTQYIKGHRTPSTIISTRVGNDIIPIVDQLVTLYGVTKSTYIKDALLRSIINDAIKYGIDLSTIESIDLTNTEQLENRGDDIE